MYKFCGNRGKCINFAEIGECIKFAEIGEMYKFCGNRGKCLQVAETGGKFMDTAIYYE